MNVSLVPKTTTSRQLIGGLQSATKNLPSLESRLQPGLPAEAGTPTTLENWEKGYKSYTRFHGCGSSLSSEFQELVSGESYYPLTTLQPPFC